MYNSEDKTSLLEAQMENIVDNNGHKRFIEGDISLYSYMPAGMTLTYGKWSLSGTHLMIVLAGNLADETVLPNSADVARLTTLPSWILEKVYPVFNDVIERKKFDASASSWGVQQLDVALRKSSDYLFIRLASALTLTANRGFRIAFDLLIDNAEPETQGE